MGGNQKKKADHWFWFECHNACGWKAVRHKSQQICPMCRCTVIKIRPASEEEYNRPFSELSKEIK